MSETAGFLADYIVMPETSILVLSAWVMAAWLSDRWDRFPHIAITSPEKRCGKTLLLDLLFLIVPRGRYTTNISPAALYRVVEQEKPTLLMDESQSISRRGSETSEVIRELLNAGITKNAKVMRCGGERWDQIQEFSVYSPKVFAMIGEPDSVLADRCLPIAMKRRAKEDRVKRYRSRLVEPIGRDLHDRLEKWAEEHGEQVAKVYDGLEPFDIENDRMAELLLPLQAVLKVMGEGRPLELLERYAKGLDERDRERELQSPGVQLLSACRELFGKTITFLQTDNLILRLITRLEEPWGRWNNGQPISREKLAGLLRPFGIRSHRTKDQKQTGYFRCDFEEAWCCYLSPLPPQGPSPRPRGNPANPASPASPGIPPSPANSPKPAGKLGPLGRQLQHYYGQGGQ